MHAMVPQDGTRATNTGAINAAANLPTGSSVTYKLRLSTCRRHARICAQQ
jgi:hypothetical protein